MYIIAIKIAEGTLLRFKSKEVGNAGIEGFLWEKPATCKFKQSFR